MRRFAAVGWMAAAWLAVACAPTQLDDGDASPHPPADADPNAPDADPTAPDAGGRPDAEPLGGPCDPFAQDCGPGRKCAWIWDGPASGDGHFGCARNGSIDLGAPCSPPAVAGDTDDCIAGAHCVFGECHEVCSIDPPDACSLGGGCVGVTGLEFDVCLPACDPLAQDCGAGKGCYLGSDGPVCADVVGGGVSPGGACVSLNDCRAGAGCFAHPSDPDCADPSSPACSYLCLDYCDHAAYDNVNDPANCAAGDICIGIAGEDVYGACF